MIGQETPSPYNGRAVSRGWRMSSHQESRSPIPSTLFLPGAGARPPFLAGRAAEQRILAGAAEEIDEKDERGRANVPQDVVLYGPRGNGKTALTLWLQDFAAAEPRGWMSVRINAGDCGDDPDALARILAGLGVQSAAPWTEAPGRTFAAMFALACVRWEIRPLDGAGGLAWSWADGLPIQVSGFADRNGSPPPLPRGHACAGMTVSGGTCPRRYPSFPATPTKMQGKRASTSPARFDRIAPRARSGRSAKSPWA